MSKGFFDNYNIGKAGTTSMAADMGVEEGDGEGGWGDDAELVLEGKRFNTWGDSLLRIMLVSD